MNRSFRFSKSLEIYATPKKVFEHLTDLRNQLSLHAFLCEIRVQDDYMSKNGKKIVNYIAIEEVSVLGLVPFRSRHIYQMALGAQEDWLEIHSYSFPGIHIKAEISIVPINSECSIVKDKVEVTTPWLFSKYFRDAAGYAHDSMLRTLKLRLEEM